jgi:hypothetical protein
MAAHDMVVSLDSLQMLPTQQGGGGRPRLRWPCATHEQMQSDPYTRHKGLIAMATHNLFV